MSEPLLIDRRMALEESFFRAENAKLKEKLAEQAQAKAGRQALIDATGIRDEALLDALVKLEIAVETLIALELVPLIEVAWADGHVDDKERSAILAAAEAQGVSPECEVHQLLENWLATRPDADVLSTWKEYISAICAELIPAEKDQLKHILLDHALDVAKAAGGILGLGNKVSKVEQAVLDDLKGAFG
jgi:hypothetical protein